MVDFARLLRDGQQPPLVPRLVLGLTGNQPPTLGGGELRNPVREWVRAAVRAETERLAALWLGRPDEGRIRAHIVDASLRATSWGPGGPVREGVLCACGGARGADQDACGVWARMGLPYVVLQPSSGREAAWPAEERERYGRVLAKAAGVHTPDPHHTRHGSLDGGEVRKLTLAQGERLCSLVDVVCGWKRSYLAQQVAWVRAHPESPVAREVAALGVEVSEMERALERAEREGCGK